MEILRNAKLKLFFKVILKITLFILLVINGLIIILGLLSLNKSVSFYIATFIGLKYLYSKIKGSIKEQKEGQKNNQDLFIDSMSEEKRNIFDEYIKRFILIKIKPFLQQQSEAHLNKGKLNINYDNFYLDLERLRILLKTEENIDIEEKQLKQYLETSIKNVLVQDFKEGIHKISGDVFKDVIYNLGKNAFLPYNIMCLSMYVGKDAKEVKKILHSARLEVEKEKELEKFKKEIGLPVTSKYFTMDYVDTLSGYDFEEFLENLFKEFGFVVIHTSFSGDQGADLIVEAKNKKIAIQAKNYLGSVGNSAVQEVIAARDYYKCDLGMVITNSYFTNSAISLAEKTNVILVDRDKLKEILENGKMAFLSLIY